MYVHIKNKIIVATHSCLNGPGVVVSDSHHQGVGTVAAGLENQCKLKHKFHRFATVRQRLAQ